MTADPARAQAVFLAAAGLPHPADRAAYLGSECAGDATLRARVDALLRAHDQPDSLLDAPLVGPPGDNTRTLPADGRPDPAADTHTHAPGADDPGDALSFLAPAGRPGSLGRLGHYEVLEVLGRGGFGIVYRAFDDVLQRVVAVKVLSPTMAATSPARKRFLREAQSSAQVRHENVVQVYEIGEQPLPYLVMEFVAGQTLQQRLDRTGPLDVPEVLRVGRQVAAGLAAAHAQGLIHRDIKPSNILIDGGPQGQAKITDFGLARAADDASLTRSGVVAGTPMYMAPEQARGETLDHRADLFSLGSVLYAMLTGRPPFRASNTPAVLKRVAEDTPRPIREVIPEVSDWLCRVVGKLHAKDAAERFQSAGEVAELLADCEQQVRAHGALKDFSRIPGGKPARLGRVGRGAVAAGLVALLVLGVNAALFGGAILRYAAGRSVVEFAGLGDPDVEKLLVRRDGELVATVDRANRRADLPPGEYEVEAVCIAGYQATKFQVETSGLWRWSGAFQRVEGRPAIRLEVRRGDATTVAATAERVASPMPTPAPADGGWVQLFNGRDLTGWKTHPDQPGTWEVKDGVLTGSSRQSYLFTGRGDYRNFHLRADVRLNAGGDSGIRFRAPFALREGVQVGSQTPAGGYEAEISRSPTNAVRTGSVWKVKPEGPPIPLHSVADDPLAGSDGWFTLEVIATQNRFVTKVNGREVANCLDSLDAYPTGHLALQVFSPNTVVQFRKIEIRELPPASPEVPKRAADVLPFLAGSWKVERQNLDPKSPAAGGTVIGTFAYSFVAGGKLLRGRSSVMARKYGDPVAMLDLWSFEPGNNMLRRWIAQSDGDTHGTSGQFNPANRTLTTSRRIGENDAVHQYEFVDPNTFYHQVFVKDAGGTITAEFRNKWTRVGGPVTVPNLPLDPNRPAEMKVLDRLAGEWRNELTVKDGAAPDKPKVETARAKSESILGGRFVESVVTREPDNHEDYALAWFDPATNRYRQWFFHGDGYVVELGGTWDEAAKTLTWTSTDGRLTGKWVFQGDGVREFQHLIKGPDGKVLSDASGVSRRVAAAPVPRPAAVGGRSPFVLVGADGVAGRSFATLAEALDAAPAGGTIEVRGDGPFVTDGLTARTPVTIRAGAGSRPVIEHDRADGLNAVLLTATSGLVLEGLELRNPLGPVGRGRTLVRVTDGPFSAANCRFVTPQVLTRAEKAPRVDLRNCEFVSSWGMAAAIDWSDPPSKGAFRMSNCVTANWALFMHPSSKELDGVELEFRDNTITGAYLLSCYSGGELLGDGKRPRPFRVTAANNVLTVGHLFRVEIDRTRTTAAAWPLDRTDRLAQALFDWKGDRNLVRPTAGYQVWHGTTDGTMVQAVKSRADWKAVWGAGDTGTIEGEARLIRGPLRPKVVTTPHQITPDDFRLADDSPGKKAGPGDKDLGADIDLVGPGEAYERWKKTPDYRAWPARQTGATRE